MPLKHEDEAIPNKIDHDFKSVQSYRFLNNFHDVAANTALGTYGHRVTSYNFYDKSYLQADYNYHLDYQNSKHTDFENKMSDNNKQPVVGTAVDYDNELNLSDYP